MKKRRLSTLLFLFGAVSVAGLRCSGTDVSGGGTIETTNGVVVGSVRNRDNTPAVNAIIKLFPDGYDPVAGEKPEANYTDTVDTDGSYRLNNIAAGKYTVIGRNRVSATCFIKTDIEVYADSVTDAGTGTMDKGGSIKADLSSSIAESAGYAYIPGTDISSPLRNDRTLFLSDIPAHSVRNVIFVTGRAEKRNILRKEITLGPGDTATINQPLWKYSRILTLNTTSSGADVSGDVYGFPLLIRLNGENFDFTQTGPGGMDVIFTSRNNQLLPHEVERWDAASRRAEIWVKVDTIRGNDSVQSILMYWGNPDVPSRPSSASVFDTGAGFAAVWHLSDAPGDSTRDATVNHYHGISPESGRPQVSEGVIGGCRHFDGTSNFITMPNTADSRLNFPADGEYTVSAWVYLDALEGATRFVAGKGYEQYFLRLTYFPSGSPLWEFSEFGESKAWQVCTSAAASGRWTLLTGVSCGKGQRLYINGVLADSMPVTYPNENFSRNTSYDFSIGKFLQKVNVPESNEDSYCFFKGSIDEVRVIGRNQSPQWVRLCYMNQRPDDRLVVFK